MTPFTEEEREYDRRHGRLEFLRIQNSLKSESKALLSNQKADLQKYEELCKEKKDSIQIIEEVLKEIEHLIASWYEQNPDEVDLQKKWRDSQK